MGTDKNKILEALDLLKNATKSKPELRQLDKVKDTIMKMDFEKWNEHIDIETCNDELDVNYVISLCAKIILQCLRQEKLIVSKLIIILQSPLKPIPYTAVAYDNGNEYNLYFELVRPKEMHYELDGISGDLQIKEDTATFIQNELYRILKKNKALQNSSIEFRYA